MASKNNRKKNPLDYMREERQRNKAKRTQKRNKQSRKPRRRDWNELAHTNEPAVEKFERIMPLDEGERRRAVEDTMQKIAEPEMDEPLADLPHARVIEVSSGMCRVAVDDRVLLCTVRGALKTAETGYTNIITVGDYVVVTETGDERGYIEDILPRRNLIARPDPAASHRQQPIAANLDQLLVVASWRNPHIWYELIDRYIITAERSDITPLICVNKIDLAENADEINAALAPYRTLGYTVILTSAETGEGIRALRTHLHNKVTVVAGLSGVGKSSLLSAVQPGFELKTGNVNEERGQGRHTTTQALMLPISGGYVVDTPGIREFGLAGITPHDLLAHYPDIMQVSAQCKFTDCTHTHEPDCAVRAAVEDGDLSATRFHNYKTILQTLAV